MRWVVAAIIVVMPAIASAEMLVIEEDHGVAYSCPSGKKWDDVTKCLTKQGRPVIIKTLGGAKLLRLDQLENQKWVDGGVYLYVEKKGEWKIAGTWFGRGTEYELTDFKTIAVGTHTGFRIDIAQASPLYVQLDGLTTTPAVRRSYHTLFCGGQNRYCTYVTKSCEVLVRGRAYWTFRGNMQVNGNDITIAGDRRVAGPFCTQAEKVQLGWPQIN